MAKKFDLAALMGEAVSKSNTGEMQVEQIPLAEIEENENNSYAQNDIDELAESIKVIGLQQPLVVRRKAEGGYLLLAGHRRRNALALLDRKTAPCIVLDADLDPSIQTLILHWTNTMARGGGGLTAEYTGQAAKEIEAALRDLQARGVVELPGKLRSYVAEVRFNLLAVQTPIAVFVRAVQLPLQTRIALAQLVGGAVVDAVTLKIALPRLGQPVVDCLCPGNLRL